jgi:hypothetical protein
MRSERRLEGSGQTGRETNYVNQGQESEDNYDRAERPVDDEPQMVDEDTTVGYDRVEIGIPMNYGSSNNLYEVKIQPLNSGFLVNVGCQRVAVETPETLLKALKMYYNNPSEFQENWFKNKNINKLQ